MKISELNTNTYLNNDGAPENSYLLINYAAGQGMSASTQKVSLDTLGKAVAAKLNLPIAVTDNAGNVTGLRHVEAAGNTYSIQDLNASFGGGGSGGGAAFDPTQGFQVYIPNPNTSDQTVYLEETYTAYPLCVVPDPGASAAYVFGVRESNDEYFAAFHLINAQADYCGPSETHVSYKEFPQAEE